MKTLNFFRDYIDSHPPKALIFHSDNQDDPELPDTTSLQLSFSKVVIGEHPNVIHMSDGKNSMTLYNVKGVEIDEKQSIIGTILRVVCGSGGRDHRYTVVLK